MQFYQHPEWSTTIRNRYWFLRYARSFQQARRRKEYRAIEREKKRLIESGVDGELIRLYCRMMVNPSNKNAEQRFWTAWHESKQASLEFGE